MTASKIEWTDRSDWNPIRGCTRKSQGCVNCYAEVLAARFSKPGQWGHGFAHIVGGDHRWTGKVEVQWERLLLPLSWRTPAKIFACSTSDPFHEALAMDEIATIYAVAVAAHHLCGHVTQFLTKRADRMREMLNSEEFWEQVNAEAGGHVMERVDPLDRRSDDARATLDDYGPDAPPPGVWLGVSVEDQANADERRDDFRATPAVVKFVSYEPAIGPVDWTGWEFVHQIIGGGEAGPHSRPMHPDWQRATRDFCAAHGIAYFFKQWGEWGPDGGPPDGRPDKAFEGSIPCAVLVDGTFQQFANWIQPPIELCSGHGEWVYRFGKRNTGRHLDGMLHDEIPA